MTVDKKIVFMIMAMHMLISASAASRRAVRMAFTSTSSIPNIRSTGFRGNSIETYRQVTTSTADVISEDNTSSNTRSSSLHTVMVKRNRQSQNFREGAPLVFGNSIAATFSENGDDSSIPLGSLVAVYVSRDDDQKEKGKKYKKNKTDNEAAYAHTNFESSEAAQYHTTINNSQLIGYGVYNPHSMYRVRILCHAMQHPILAKESKRKQKQRVEDHDGEILKSILKRKMSDAINLRLAMNLPSDSTDTYRLVNGEGDGCSGLAVDIIGGQNAIVMSSAAWCEVHKVSIMEVLEGLLNEHPSYSGVDIEIIWRNTPSRLKQDGYEVSVENEQSEEDDTTVIATESSVKYLTYPYSNGQKTGFYCDQRDNRLMVAQYCQDKRVLDLCCYNGGFALNAMVQGAAYCVGVDSSQDAIDAATANAMENCFDSTKISFVRDDIAAYMKSAMDEEKEFDVIVLDPPKLAPNLSSLDKASRKYHALNRDAMNLINREKGGLLLTCTCSAAMTQKDGGQYFLNMVNGAGLSAKRRVTLLRVNGAAPCHTQSPASFPAGAYLTAALFHVGPLGS
jgi:23S rRNA G2069 N7-methylase RlmK/C1962 C5-methylase RlmI